MSGTVLKPVAESPTFFHVVYRSPNTPGWPSVAKMAKKKPRIGNENEITMTEQDFGRGASGSLVDGSAAFMTESIQSELYSRGKLPSQSSAFSNIGSGFDLPDTPYSASLSTFSYTRPMHNVGLQKSQRKMFSKVLKKKTQSFVNAKQRRNFLGASRLVHHTKEKKKNCHPVTSYGGPIRQWPTKKRGRISSLIRSRSDDYTTTSNISAGIKAEALEGLSDNVAADQPPSTASDFVYITNAGDGDLLLRPWSQRKQKAFQRKPSLEGTTRSTNAKRKSPYVGSGKFRALSPIVFPIRGSGLLRKAKLSHSMTVSKSIRPLSSRSSLTPGNSSTGFDWKSINDEGGVNSSVVLPDENSDQTVDHQGTNITDEITRKDNLVVVLMPSVKTD